jgi:hypothetical protein
LFVISKEEWLKRLKNVLAVLDDVLFGADAPNVAAALELLRQHGLPITVHLEEELEVP